MERRFLKLAAGRPIFAPRMHPISSGGRRIHVRLELVVLSLAHRPSMRGIPRLDRLNESGREGPVPDRIGNLPLRANRERGCHTDIERTVVDPKNELALTGPNGIAKPLITWGLLHVRLTR